MPGGQVEDGPARAEEFAGAARRFVALIDARADHSAEALLLAVQPLLLELAHRASLLPEVEVDDPFEREARMSQVEWRRLYESLGAQLGGLNLYWDSDPWESDEPGRADQASLADDLADVYRDLSDGLPPAGVPASPEAVWRWRFSFGSHWGEHALRAARAIQARAAHHGLGEDEEADVVGA
jgi:hypothetical protein